MGQVLSELLIKGLQDEPYVGDIRGKGLFWGIEFVRNRDTKEPWPQEAHVATGISDLGRTEDYGIVVYPGAGTVDGILGDHIIVAPPYTVTKRDVEYVAETVTRLIKGYFSGLE